MSRVRNATDFRREYRSIHSNYENRFARLIARVRREYVGTPNESNADNMLEHHVRAYVINAVLAALNWRMDRQPQDDLPNLIPEASGRSQQTGTIRRLDYLGLEKDTNEPLLIVETKRPSAKLPYLHGVSSHSEVIVHGLKDQELGSEWDGWLRDINRNFPYQLAWVVSGPLSR